jgi:hydrogenase maturation protein HypF
VRVEGTVQGVGFRPYVYRLAGELQLAGYVLNDARGVLVEVEGTAAAVERFLGRLEPDAPPLARIERVLITDRATSARGAGRAAAPFAIRESPHGGPVEAPVTPDSATCEDCLRELRDPGDRRYRYPFINCTNCGPRFTIVRGVPYDRALTTMAAFQMCARCSAEYEDPADRRFHAQPNACAECGPSLSLLRPDGTAEGSAAALRRAAALLHEGAIAAVKGIGGYHLACRADDQAAVARLRARKHREEKPFALMVADVVAAQGIVHLDARAREALIAPERPIVLAPRRAGTGIASAVAPGAAELGVMLPYSPLHHLLLSDLGDLGGNSPPLVMTSGNASDEPIAYRDEDALLRLGAIADVLLVHDRPIETRVDDSVVRIVDAPPGAQATMLRRSRGFVPASIDLPFTCERPILACGAELKNTFCLAKGTRAWVSHHVGDLENYETLRSFTDGIEHLKRLVAVQPQVVAHDLHPEYLSTKYAMECDREQLVGVQHHHAHLAACLAEHGEDGVALGAIFDGTGYGPDGTVWGGELLLGDTSGFRRVGALTPVRLPGGARAIAEPWRMACAWLIAAEPVNEVGPAIPATLAGVVDPRAWRQVAGLASSGVQSPVTTSMGRLFDAVSALCGLRARVSYEGQAAVELEAACDRRGHGRYPIAVHDAGAPDGLIEIDPRETIAAVMRDVRNGVPTATIASRFHMALGSATVEALSKAASAHRCETVVLSGGVFQNRRLLEDSMRGAQKARLRVLVPERLPLGDGAISYGQAVVAARKIGEAASS